MLPFANPLLGTLDSSPLYVSSPALDELLAGQVTRALQDHADAGRSVSVWRDGRVVTLTASDLRLELADRR